MKGSEFLQLNFPSTPSTTLADVPPAKISLPHQPAGHRFTDTFQAQDQYQKMSAETANAPPATDATSYLDLGISLAINNWPALTLAVESNWGGPKSDDKRDWLCGAISEMLTDRPETDAEDLEDVLIQVMNDEFDVVVDDDTAADVAQLIMEMKEQTARQDFSSIQDLWEKYQKKSQQKSAAAAMFKQVESKDEDQETDDEEDDTGDVDMDDAPALVRAPREKAEPEVDEDGFTMVSKKR